MTKMTAVAVQQRSQARQQYSPRQSPRSSTKTPLTPQPQSQAYNSYASAQTHADEHSNDSSSNGAPNTMSVRTSASNRSLRSDVATGGQTSSRDSAPLTPIANGSTNGYASGRDAKQPDQNRPTSAPGGKVTSSDNLNPRDSMNEDSDRELTRRRPQVFLHRSKSDFGPRGDDSDSQRYDGDNRDWGARHGFEDHYASEEYVSQLANVSCL
jgi:regulatory associated protein of mTOR